MTGKDVKRQMEETHAAVGEALTITRGGTVQMPKAHWDRIIAAGLNLKPALAPCVVLTREEAEVVREALGDPIDALILLTPDEPREEAVFDCAHCGDGDALRTGEACAYCGEPREEAGDE